MRSIIVGDEPPALTVPITTSFVVAAAIASRDYEGVHHNPDEARRRGAADIFTNIATTNGLVARFVTDWAGPGVRLRRLRITLGRPNHPGDVLTLTGRVVAVAPDGDVEVDVVGRNGSGVHVTGLVAFGWAVPA